MMTNTTPIPHSIAAPKGFRTRRGAATIICAMTATVVFLAIAGTAIKTALRSRQERKTERDLHQVDFLLQSGFIRAKTRLEESNQYSGEIWLDQPSPYDQSHWHIDISVQKNSAAESASDSVRVKIIARISNRNYSPAMLQRSREHILSLDSIKAATSTP